MKFQFSGYVITECLPVNSHPKKELIMTFLDTLRIGLKPQFTGTIDVSDKLLR